MDLPVPPPDVRHYDMDEAAYLAGGRRDCDRIARITGREPGSWGPVLDFGCAEGRMLRHWPGETWGIDIREPPIAWLREHVPHPERFQVVGYRPPTCLPSGHFDLIYAYSVFTHLHATTLPWLLELRRLLSRQGTLIITVNDEGSAKWLSVAGGESSWYWAFREQYPEPRLDSGDFESLAYGAGLQWEETREDATPYLFGLTSFHSRAYITGLVSQLFVVKEYMPHFHSCQSGLVLAPRSLL